MNKKCYVQTMSMTFPATHPDAGKPTYFMDKIKSGTKIHTIRPNYELWAKRVENVNAGSHYLSVRQWLGRAYNSKQKEHLHFEKLGIQKLSFREGNYFHRFIDGQRCDSTTRKLLALNDGLDLLQLFHWFAPMDLNQDFAIIHFSDFRYLKEQL